jgi:type VI secretion system protein ImpM
MTAPIWRFSLAPGYAGPESVAGVMMPSVDRVGRQFPLTLAAVVPTDLPLRTLALQAVALDALELVALDALDDGMTREHLAERLAEVRLAAWTDPSVIRATTQGYVVSSSDALALLPDLALREVSCEAVFSTAVEGQARLMATRSLPGSRAAAALFDLHAPLWSEGLT